MHRALYITVESFFVKKVQMDIYLANFTWEPSGYQKIRSEEFGEA